MTKSSSSPLSEQAAHQIMDMILVEHRFNAGDKLPNETELAEELGISRVTLREAVRMVCARGLVEIRRGVGTYVVSADPAILADGGFSPLDASGAGIRDLLEIRLMVEPMAAYYAAKRASDEEIEAIDAHRRRIEELAAEGRSFLHDEQDFHIAIATASHNLLMERLLPIINRSITADLMYFKESTDYSLRDHREIVQYIRDRDPAAAKAAMRMHIVHCFRIAGQEID
ncbi:MAG: FadR family transcriptional regulator [Oscillospiraceae bacterium]|nr:FadR family transcriptional regulator [Oscillospiraceae bacterium]